MDIYKNKKALQLNSHKAFLFWSLRNSRRTLKNIISIDFDIRNNLILFQLKLVS